MHAVACGGGVRKAEEGETGNGKAKAASKGQKSSKRPGSASRSRTVAELAGVGEHDPIAIEAVRGEVTLKHGARVPSLTELVAQITPENRYAETETGPELGRENIEW